MVIDEWELRIKVGLFVQFLSISFSIAKQAYQFIYLALSINLHKLQQHISFNLTTKVDLTNLNRILILSTTNDNDKKSKTMQMTMAAINSTSKALPVIIIVI